MKKTKKVPLNISLDPEIKEAAEKMADDDDRSISNFIGKLIRTAKDKEKPLSTITE